MQPVLKTLLLMSLIFTIIISASEGEAVSEIGTLSSIITSIDNNNIPTKYILEQNHPNPFNPSTIIKYSIPINMSRESSIVSLKVYDVLGREVATLINREQSAGNYEVRFNASNLMSGIYYYRLQSGEFNQSKKMVLLK